MPEARRYRALDRALELQLIPDPVLRAGSVYGAWARERREAKGGIAAQTERLRALVEWMSTGPIAEVTEPRGGRPDELPPELVGLVLGPRRKCSGCLWPEPTTTLGHAEEAMLSLSCERAQVADGMRILDLGCGWGALSLWLAERYPKGEVIGVSGSARQREWIEAARDERGLTNLTVVIAEINDYRPAGRRFDRIMSIGLFERLRNWRELLRRLSTWLRPDGKAFVHLFSHRTMPYLSESTWAAERFHPAVLMPSHDLLPRFQEDLLVRDAWTVPGTHYARTVGAWLANLDGRRDEALEILRRDGRSPAEARRLLGGLRLLLLSARETWDHRGGNRWLVSHYLLEPRRGGTSPDVRIK